MNKLKKLTFKEISNHLQCLLTANYKVQLRAESLKTRTKNIEKDSEKLRSDTDKINKKLDKIDNNDIIKDFIKLSKDDILAIEPAERELVLLRVIMVLCGSELDETPPEPPEEVEA